MRAATSTQTFGCFFMPRKLSLPFVIIATVVALTSCTARKTPLQTEADAKAQEWWNATVAKCGDDHFIISKYQ
jgi:hypothetical protein